MGIPFLFRSVMAFCPIMSASLAQSLPFNPVAEHIQFAHQPKSFRGNLVDFNGDGFLDAVGMGFDASGNAVRLWSFANDKTGKFTVADADLGPHDPYDHNSSTCLSGQAGDGSLGITVVQILPAASFTVEDDWFLKSFPAGGAAANPSMVFTRFLDAKAGELKSARLQCLGFPMQQQFLTYDIPPDHVSELNVRAPYFPDLVDSAGNYGLHAVGDFNGDGRMDGAAVGSGSEHSGLLIRLSLPDGSPFDTVYGGFDLAYGSMMPGDFDNDGDLDLVLSGDRDQAGQRSSQPAYLFLENRKGRFFEIPHGLGGVSFGIAALGDLDNDGDLDLFAGGDQEHLNEPDSFMVYRNTLSKKNAAPSSPVNLSFFIAGKTGTFKWGKSTDDLTPQAGLTYNLRIGTKPGGNDIVNPGADPATGRLAFPHFGNAPEGTEWAWFLERGDGWVEVPALLPGKYYWSVQAIDNGYAASAFAPEQTFTIPGTSAIRVGPAPARAGGSFRGISFGRARGERAADGRRSD